MEFRYMRVGSRCSFMTRLAQSYMYVEPGIPRRHTSSAPLSRHDGVFRMGMGLP